MTEFLCALARSMGLDRVAALFDCTMGSDVDVPVAEQLLTEAEAEREVYEPLGPRISGGDAGLHDLHPASPGGVDRPPAPAPDAVERGGTLFALPVVDGSQQHTTREATGPVGAAETTRSGGGT